MISKPTELNPDLYFKAFIENLNDVDLIPALERSRRQTIELINSIPTSKESFAYATGKWSIKQLYQHLADCERVFSYRILCIARMDSINLPGFDEDLYVKNDFSNELCLSQIGEDFDAARKSTTSLIKSLSPNVLDQFGKANNLSMSPRIIGWFNVGHADHHNQIIKERYL